MNRIEYLIKRYLEKTETKEELDELMKLVASGRYREAVEDSFAEAVRERLRSSGDPADAALHEELAEIRSRIDLSKPSEERVMPVHRFHWYKVASVAVLLIIASVTLWRYKSVHFLDREVSAYSEGSSGRKKVLLPDGSIVWLKGNSSLTYPSAFSGSTRPVSLTGEALFEVAKDAAHPFIIDCGDITTTVLGTSFNIRSGENDTEIMVLTGKVSVASKTESTKTVILPNEKIVYNHIRKALTKTPAGAGESITVTEGTEYSMSFEDTPMTEVIKRIEGKFGIAVAMDDPKLGNCMITANLTDQSLDLTLEMISKSLRTTYKINRDQVLISGPGCD